MLRGPVGEQLNSIVEEVPDSREDPASLRSDEQPAPTVVHGRSWWQYYLDECRTVSHELRTLTSNWTVAVQPVAWKRALIRVCKVAAMTIVMIGAVWICYRVGKFAYKLTGYDRLTWDEYARECDEHINAKTHACGGIVHEDDVRLFCVWDESHHEVIYLGQPRLDHFSGRRQIVQEHNSMCPNAPPVNRFRFEHIEVAYYPINHAGLGGRTKTVFEGPIAYCIQHLFDEDDIADC